tara:strand:- start:389 stop:643 length:255 start_codon:yes stop_codon:yes gene_type:complete
MTNKLSRLKADVEDVFDLSEAEKLQVAAMFIDSVVGNMDMDGSECRCCGAMRRHRFNEYKVAVALGPLVKKLANYADMLGGGDG